MKLCEKCKEKEARYIARPLLALSKYNSETNASSKTIIESIELDSKKFYYCKDCSRIVRDYNRLIKKLH